MHARRSGDGGQDYSATGGVRPADTSTAGSRHGAPQDGPLYGFEAALPAGAGQRPGPGPQWFSQD
jgi:hypothetical protein